MRVDLAQGAGESDDVMAVSIDRSVSIRFVNTNPLSSVRSSSVVACSALALVGPGCWTSIPDAAEQLADLADGVHRNPVPLQLLQIAAGRRRQRVVTPAVRAPKIHVGTDERARDHPPDGVLGG